MLQHCHILVFDIFPSVMLCVHKLILSASDFILAVGHIASSIIIICNVMLKWYNQWVTSLNEIWDVK